MKQVFYKLDSAASHKDYSLVDFGVALRAVTAGKKIARDGWDGRGMFVDQKAYPEEITCNRYLQVRMLNGSHSIWVPSINDMLATDWIISD